MVQVTLEVPEALLGDIYIAVGTVLERARDEADQAAKQAAVPGPSDSDPDAGGA
jgi:hypothetical protein